MENNSIAPDGTEEVKPNLFVKPIKNGWKQVHPLKWQGKWRIKEEVKSIFNFRTLFNIAIILFIAWSYKHDVKALTEFHNFALENTTQFCEITLSSLNRGALPPCPDGTLMTPDMLYKCIPRNLGIDWSTVQNNG